MITLSSAGMIYWKMEKELNPQPHWDPKLTSKSDAPAAVDQHRIPLLPLHSRIRGN
jgi:hypothetical protein